MKKLLTLLLVLMLSLGLLIACAPADMSADRLYRDFTPAESAKLVELFGEKIPFLANDEYYFNETEDGVEFYTVGNTEAEFTAYLALFAEYSFVNIYTKDGVVHTIYNKGDIAVDISSYTEEDKLVVKLLVYSIDGDDDTTPPAGGDDTTPPTGGDDTTPPTGGDDTTPPTGGDDTTPPTGGDDTTPPTGGDDTTPPTGDDDEDDGNPLKNGAKVVIAAPAYGKLLSMVKTGYNDYYNAGINYIGTDYSVAGNDEIFIVTVNSDDTYTFTSLSGKVLALAASNNSLNESGTNTRWVLEEVSGSDGLYLVKNVGRGNYLEWYASKDNWSTYDDPSDSQFHIAFYLVSDSESNPPSGGSGSGDDTPSGGGSTTPPSGGEGGGTGSGYTYNDFTSNEKALFNQYIGEVIPFVPNNEYYVEGCDEANGQGYEYGMCFYTFGNTQNDFTLYRALFTTLGYELYGTEEDSYGDTWYTYTKGDVVVSLSYYYYEGDNVIDLYVYSESLSLNPDEDGSGGSGSEGDTPSGDSAAAQILNALYALGEGEQLKGSFTLTGVITALDDYNNPTIVVEGFEGQPVYCYKLVDSRFVIGATITVTASTMKNYQGTYEFMNCVLDSITLPSGGSGSTGGEVDADLITNDGAGLPSDDGDGIVDIDFTTAEQVKDVTDQGYYLGGCPTTGSPKVLVIPVEFSDALAKDRGYTIDALKAAFLAGGRTDYYSVYDYYFISSGGKLTLDITVLDGWFKPKYNSTYYKNQTMYYYGDEVAIGDQMIMDEALAYLDKQGFDLSEFDSDGNGMIDAVVMINTLDVGEDDFNWAYRYWNIYTDDDGYYFEYDRTSANDYVWACYQFLHDDGDDYDNTELLNTYTFIHEFAHILGADDYYDTAYVDHPLGGHDMMDSMLGDHSAFTKFNLGWITSSRLIVTSSSVTVTLDSFIESGDTIILANDWNEALGAYQEYYIIVYYTSDSLNSPELGAGLFDGEGIVVYHINASLYSEEQDGEVYYDIYYNNTDPSGEYGTEENLIELVECGDDELVYGIGDSLSTDITDDSGEALGYIFTVVSLGESATLTFTKI